MMTKKSNGTYDANPVTKALRPQTNLSDQQIEEVRKACKEGQDPVAIAQQKGVPLEDVKIALASLRTPVNNPGRKTLNVSPEAHKKVMASRLPGESAKEATDRLLLGKN